MTSLPKTWENARIADPSTLGLKSSSPGAPRNLAPAAVGSPTHSGGPPPLPSRARNRSSTHSLYPPYNPSPYPNHPSHSYFPSYSSSYYPSMFGGTPFRRSPSDEFESRFVQLAEERSQSAFDSIESFVRTFSSMTVMLESSFQAMYMSFRAVLSMADNMSKMRTMFINFLSNIAILKSLYWIYRKLLYLLGLVSENPLREEIWAAAVNADKSLKRRSSVTSSSWPVVAFFALLFGAPYLMLKLSPTDIDIPAQRIKAVALYDFQSTSKGDLPFLKGDIISLPIDFRKQQTSGWVVARAANGQSGSVPLNYLSLSKQSLKPTPATPSE